jgi:membrane fusion protein (multidrug efflux system)
MRARPIAPYLAAWLLTTLAGCSAPEPPPPLPAPAVEYQTVSEQAVAMRFEFVARTRAQEDAEIRAQISGTILERSFEEGQEVEEGQLLFRIDPRPYRAALSTAQADVARTEATLEVAERNLARGEELAPDGFISSAELDQLRGNRDTARASLEAARAAVERAQIDLGFTDIKAPFTGRAGRSQTSIGDLVNPTSGALVTLVKQDPMLVDFDVDEQALANRLRENQERAAQGLEPVPFTPRLQLVTGDMYPLEGRIDYANNRVNASTGTVTVTASFPNPEDALVPGQFTRIIVQRGQPEKRLLIPQPAVLEDMQGRYVYIVGDGDVIERRNVRLGQREGVDWVVESGLEAGLRVVVNGVQKIRPGMPVSASPVAARPHQEDAGNGVG